MSLAAKLLSASGGAVDKLYVDDVFSAYTYTGNASTQTINNGIDMAGEGGMIWTKARADTNTHAIYDSARSYLNRLETASSGTGVTQTLGSPTSSGYSIGIADSSINGNGQTYISWTFRKAPKFFDVVTYTGNGVAGRQIPHALSIAPGMVIVKATVTDAGASNGYWVTTHRSISGSNVYLNASTAKDASGPATIGDLNNFLTGVYNNTSGITYVAYLFAHDTSADGIVQCGSFTPSANIATVNLGWEPQYVLIKASGGVGDWYVWDTSRPFSLGSNSALRPNTAGAEITPGAIYPTATGFYTSGLFSNAPHIYLAIRRPNKPPTLGTQVYNAIARTGTSAAAAVTGVGFAPDLVMQKGRTEYPHYRADRLRGHTQWLSSNDTSAETTSIAGKDITSFDMDGATVNSPYNTFVNYSASSEIYHFFKRAPGVFDQVCYTGTGVAKTEAHGLGVVPELMIVKLRSSANSWAVYSADVGNTKALFLDLTSTPTTNTAYWNNTTPSATVISLGAAGNTNFSAATYVAYLFATKAGISKVGSYTGNGTSQTIDCGFTTGARFVLIKRTDAAGDWYVWDTVRGLVAGNDPHLSLNSTTAEITTDDSLDPASVGFIVNQLAATNINVTSATYIYLAFA